MGLLKILKTVMGLNGTGSSTRSSGGDSTRQDVDVSVEHEPEPATESESAVKGTTDAETAGATTDTESTAEPAVEPETGAEPETEPDSSDEPDATSDDEPESAPADETEAEDPEIEGADEPVDTISGIGPAYADRLGEVGIETVGDLATADAASVAADTDLSEKRVQGWIDNARGDE